MPVIWVVSEDPSNRETLAYALVPLAEVHAGPPERARFETAPLPDLLVIAARPETERGLPQLERLLQFVRSVEPPQREIPPVLFVEPEGGQPSAGLAQGLIDDRPLGSCAWPPDPDGLREQAARLLERRTPPASLRARAQRTWVSEHVELFYAGLELPALRQAIDPRNAFRPVLLTGEAGTGRALLARYIHDLAEPPRQRLLVLPGVSLPAGGVEQRLLEVSRGQRVSVYLDALDRIEAAVQDELAHALAAGGLVGLEAIRWIASAVHPRQLTRSLRLVDWLRVDLPALRARPDLAQLARALASRCARRTGREVSVSDEALAALARYAWPHNLWELRQVIEQGVAAARQGVLRPEHLGLAGTEREREARGGGAPAVAEPAPPGAPRPSDESRAAPGPPVAAGPEPTAPRPVVRAPEGEPAAAASVAEIVGPLAEEIRKPLLTIRTYASALERRGDDVRLRRELGAVVESDLARVDATLKRLERYAAFGPPVSRAVDVAALIGSELERRRATTSERKLVILEELDREAPAALADEEQLRFAIGGLLDRALRMVPPGGDLYVGTFHHVARDQEPGRLRLLIRFHSPEDVLVPPKGVPGPTMPLEVVLARALIERMRGRFAVDASGTQDNLILIDLPL